MESIPITDAKNTIKIGSKEIETYQEKELPKIDWGEDITEDFEKSFRVRNEVVKRVLDKSDSSKNNDFIMVIECLREEFDVRVTSGKDNFHIVIPREIIMKIPSPESYTRPRRKFQASGLWLPTNPNVLYARSRKERAMRKYAKNQQMFDFPDKKPIQDTY